MIQPIDEKSARYRIIKLMFEDKFHEAEELLATYSAQGMIDKSYSDCYYMILSAIGVKPMHTPPQDSRGLTGGALANEREELKSAA